MKCQASNLPRLEYYHHQFERINTRLTDIERRLNDIHTKIESTKTSVQNLESGTYYGDSPEDEKLNAVKGEVKEIKKLLSESQAYQEKPRKVRLPL